jgi:DNA-binding FrmR family transcriptional regulator
MLPSQSDENTSADGLTAPCACARPGDGTHAVAVDPALKEAALTRLRRIEGQVRGLQRMIEEERYCIDVLTQIAAVSTALESVSVKLLEDHVRHCVGDALAAGDADTAERKSEDLLAAVRRFSRTR